MSQEFEHKESMNEEAELEAREEVREEEAPAGEKTEEEQLEECRAKLCAACNVAAEANAVKLRALAEMDNFKKRLQREKEEQARYAAENGYESFTTTLLISPYQDHELIRQLGEHMAKKYNISFLYRDFRPGFRDGHEKAKALGFYMQKYCGCIFSEEDRYAKAIARDLKNTMVHFEEDSL